MRQRTISVCILVLCVTDTSAGQVTIPGADGVKRSARVYKTVGDVELSIDIFTPRDHKASDKRPAIVFFFGGGWRSGSPGQFENQCVYLATRGMVAMAADYRVLSRHGVKPDRCVADAKSAIRWVRTHAAELGVDANRIASGGGSAGGHLGAAVGTLPDFDEPEEDRNISSIPNAMVLFNPALNTTADAWGDDPRGEQIEQRMGGKEQARALSPQHHVKKGQPPAIVFHGKDDPTVPYAQAAAFTKAMKAAGNRCELKGYDGQKHGFFNYGRGGGAMFYQTVLETDRFLASLGWLEGEPTIRFEE